MRFTIHHGDCLSVMPTLGENSVDSIVTDPPYGLSFMGKHWDHGVPGEDFWREALRVAKPGAHLLAFGGTRTVHRLACAIEDAGWEIRDRIGWVYGNGFSKGFNLKRCDVCDCKTGGDALPYDHEERAESQPQYPMRSVRESDLSQTVNAGPECGQVLQPGMSKSGPSINRAEAFSRSTRGEEPRVEGREIHRTGKGLRPDSQPGSSASEGKRICSGTHSGGGDDAGQKFEAGRRSSSRQPQSCGQPAGQSQGVRESPSALDDGTLRGRGACPRCGKLRKELEGFSTGLKPAFEPIIVARKPLVGTVAANVQQFGTGGLNVDGCRVDADEVTGWGGRPSHGYSGGLDSKEAARPVNGRWPANLIHDGSEEATHGMGAASRYFYCAKASKRDRDEGLEGLNPKPRPTMGNGIGSQPNQALANNRNHHPTVKPTSLMRYLCRLVTPPGGTVLDPFTGSGSTGKAAILEGFTFIGIEREAEYLPIIRARCEWAEGEVSATLPLEFSEPEEAIA